MVNILIVEKNGDLTISNLKNFNEEQFYKKCSFRNANNFENRHTWKIGNEYVSLYGKDNGHANSENKYDLPIPLDNVLFFGKLMLVRHKTSNYQKNEITDLSLSDWRKCYEKLFGGFESLGEESESSEEEIDPNMLTKEGYSKEDGFIVDDGDYIPQNNEEGEEAEEAEEEEAEEDDDDEDDEDEDGDDDDEDDEDDDTDVTTEMESKGVEEESDDDDEYITEDSEDISELSEEEYLSDK